MRDLNSHLPYNFSADCTVASSAMAARLSDSYLKSKLSVQNMFWFIWQKWAFYSDKDTKAIMKSHVFVISDDIKT